MLVFDLETDGLLDDVTKIHCLVIYDSEADDNLLSTTIKVIKNRLVEAYNDWKMLMSLVGHNLIGFDIPVHQKKYIRGSTRKRLY
jgi:DNA polymerase-1